MPAFTSLPREIRDSIYNAVLVEIHDRYIYNWSPTRPQHYEKRLVGLCTNDAMTGYEFWSEASSFLVLAHAWATRSRIAREACLAFYANNAFELECRDIPALLHRKLQPTVLWLEFPRGSPTKLSRLLVPSFDLKSHLRDIKTLIESDDTDCDDGSFDSGFATDLWNLLDCPNLRGVLIHIFVSPHSADVSKAFPAIAMMAEVCKALRARIGSQQGNRPYLFPFFGPPSGLNVGIEIAHSFNATEEQVQRFDVTWMWDAPGRGSGATIDTGTSGSGGGMIGRLEIGRLIASADGSDPQALLAALEARKEDFAQVIRHSPAKRIVHSEL